MKKGTARKVLAINRALCRVSTAIEAEIDRLAPHAEDEDFDRDTFENLKYLAGTVSHATIEGMLALIADAEIALEE